MTPSEYISSGMLETYALGAATPAEKLEVEAMLQQSAEVRTALEQIQEELEAYALLHAVEPDESLRAKIMSSISTAAPVHATDSAPKVISLKTEPAPSRLRFLAVAASLVLVVSVCLNLFQWKNTAAVTAENQKLDSQFTAEKTQKLFYETEMAAVKAQLGRTTQDLAFMRNPMTKNVALNSVVKDHPMNAVVYVDMSSMQVAVDPMTLPATSADQKYVLWAMVKGKPVNVGDFDMEADSSGLLMMKVSPEAEAFAISLEKSGNVEAPQGPVYVMGKMNPSQP